MASPLQLAPLVDTQWVLTHLDNPQVRLIEATSDPEEYHAGHIPGAVLWRFPEDLQHPVRLDIPDQAAMEALLSRSGIAKDTTVILYDGWMATLTFWLLRFYRHDNVGLMNGGRKAWLDASLPTTTALPAVTTTTYQVTEPNSSLRADRDLILASLNGGQYAIVDARPPEFYRGEHVASYDPPLWHERGGHIPGAINIPSEMNEAAPGAFKSTEELHAVYDSQGISPEKDVIVYCGRGGRSSQTWYVLTQLLGYPSVRLYDGSWLEWGRLMGVPIER